MERPGAHGKQRPKIEDLLRKLAGAQRLRTEERLDKQREEREVQIAADSTDRLAWADGSTPEAPQYTHRLGQDSPDEVETGIAYETSDEERKLVKKQKKATEMVVAKERAEVELPGDARRLERAGQNVVDFSARNACIAAPTAPR